MEKKRTFQKKNTTISKKPLMQTKKKAAPKTWAEVEEREVPPAESVKVPKTKAAKKYPSPRPQNTIFTSRWNLFIEDVVDRPNFKRGHLYQLELLCNLYVELHAMEELIAEFGYTYEIVGRNGAQVKPRPEVTQKNRVLSEIRSYSKMLGLLLVKDSKFTDEEESETWD